MSAYDQWNLVQYESYRPIEPGPATDGNGVRRKGAWADGVRRRVSRFYFEDRVEPVTPAELAAAHSHGDHDAIEAAHGHDGLENGTETRREVGSGQA